MKVNKLMDQLIENIEKLSDVEYDLLVEKANRKYHVFACTEEDVLNFNQFNRGNEYYSDGIPALRFIEPTIEKINVRSTNNNEAVFTGIAYFEYLVVDDNYQADSVLKVA